MLHYFVLLLEAIFFIGLAGSLIVSILAFIGDIQDFVEKDETEGAVKQIAAD
jgi:hypothetical protein